MSELTIKLIIILIPGALSTLIFGKLILHKEWGSFRFILYSILFGIVSYLILQLIINGINTFLANAINFSQDELLNDLSLWDNLSDASKIPYREVLWASVISIFTAIAATFIENKKIINNFGRIIGISNKYGDENLYSGFLNSRDVEFVYLRDIKNKLTYVGWVKSFSEDDNLSEIRLSDVDVHNYSNSEYLYSVKEVYLSLSKNEIIIELANIEENEEETIIKSENERSTEQNHEQT